MKPFVGVFEKPLNDFVALKRSLGFKYDVAADELYRFSKFSETLQLQEPILNKDVVLAWNAKRATESLTTQSRRIYTLRQFALYLQSIGSQAYVTSPDRNPHRQSHIPFIFTHLEIEHILLNSDQLRKRGHSTTPAVIPVLLRMLYGCGLRISEAVSLQNKHVDLQRGILEIKQGKFDKDRVIPMSDTLSQVCRQYYRTIHQRSSADDYFFLKADRHPITADNVYRRFREILWESGISHGGKGKGPRVHDLRHTFAVHALKRAVEKGIDLYCALPILSVYMGHASVEATSQYVRLTADVFPDIQAALEQIYGQVIPEVIWE